MPSTAKPWFTVDKEGLAKIIARDGKAFVIYELLQNAFDEPGVTQVEVALRPVPGRPAVEIIVRDDAPAGFTDLAHAWTLFAESHKKTDPAKRGRFNLGEKLVLALCEEAEIISTIGGVRFDDKGRHHLRRRRPRGTEFRGVVRATREEVDEMRMGIVRVLAPQGIDVQLLSVGGDLRSLQTRLPIATADVTLPTETADLSGTLRRVERSCKVAFVEPITGDALLYEGGIPVCPLSAGEPWSINVTQKIPLTLDRTNVPPAYLRTLRVVMLNAMHSHLRREDATAAWAREAAADARCSHDAVKAVTRLRFGGDAVAYDPSDREASNRAIAAGRPVVHAGSMSASEWANVRAAGVIPPAGRVFPTPHAFSGGMGAPTAKFIQGEEWSTGMRRLAVFVNEAGEACLEHPVFTRFYVGDDTSFYACYEKESCILSFNYRALGRDWFDRTPSDEDVLRLLIHELAHGIEANHLSDDFHEACCRVGAKLVRLALVEARTFTQEL